MKKEAGKIIRTQGGNGLVIYRNADLKEEITEEKIREKVTLGDDTLEWRFALMTSKLKTLVSLLGDDENAALPLAAMVKEIEVELQEIAEMVEKTVGDIVLLYDDAGEAWPGYTDEHVMGLAFRPANGREG